MPIKHIVFDNDGVNIDSEDVAMRIADDFGSRLVRRYQPDAPLKTDYIYTKYAGTSTDVIIDKLVEEFGLPVDQIRRDYKIPADVGVGTFIGDLVTLDTNAHFQARLQAIPGVTQALTQIHQIFGSENVALATTSRDDRMNVSLDHATDPVTGENARLHEFFPEGVRRRSGYGHANKYDEAFPALGWNPAETMIVEDSTSGVTKAQAGRPDTPVIGTVAAKYYLDKPAQAAALIEKGATIVISTMEDLPKAARWIKNGMDPHSEPTFKGDVFFPQRTGAPIRRRPLATLQR